MQEFYEGSVGDPNDLIDEVDTPDAYGCGLGDLGYIRIIRGHLLCL